MRVIVTGGAGFLGARIAELLLSEASPLPVSRLVLADVRRPAARADPRALALELDLAAPGAAARLLDGAGGCDVLFHLAAVVSGQAEADFDLGLRVNLDATRALLEAVRHTAPATRFVFASTVAVFGGELPPIVDDGTAVTPQTSYGVAKAACELLVNEYSRRGFADGRVVRLPTVSVRAGGANAAVTSFASGIVREPLNGAEAECPVPPEQELWLCSPGCAARNIAHAGALAPGALGARAVNLPGLRVAVREMVAALGAEAGAAAARRVRFRRDEFIARVVASLPTRFDNERALRLGFQVDRDFADIIRAYVREDLEKAACPASL